MAIKSKDQIKSYLSQCGDLNYEEFIDFIDSVMFEDGEQDIAPICQVTRYRRIKNANKSIAIHNLFNADNNLMAIYVKRSIERDFTISIGTSEGGAEIAKQIVDDNLVSIDCTYLFDTPKSLYISGLDEDNLAEIVVLYNSFLCDDNGEISMTLLEKIQQRISDLENEVTQVTSDLQQQINTLSNSLIQIPVGVVVQWTGELKDIPIGWSRYTGNGSLFLIGESSKYPAGSTGGESSVKLSGDEQGTFKVSGMKELSSGNNMAKQINKLRFEGGDIVEVPDGKHNSWGIK